ncbi:MAG: hypothetical protein HY064_09770 [Bacteroidetes bacterium]|nr:hypothetical protein [Bacteroidota bacterium]
MIPSHIALVDHTGKIKLSELNIVAAALQKQVIRDFSPLWKVVATVDAFEKSKDIPVGYWPVIIRNHVADAAGYHLDKQGQPFALVEYAGDWPITVSHEILEMLVDPFGNRLVPGNCLKQWTEKHPDKKEYSRVSYLVEVCDPCEDDDYSYKCNGVPVSDFITPQYFDPEGTSGGRYSFTGAIMQPRTLLKNGYLTWYIPGSHEMWQAYTGPRGGFTFEKDTDPEVTGCLRERSDRCSNRFRGGHSDYAPHRIFRPKLSKKEKGSEDKAKSLEKYILSMTKK